MATRPLPTPEPDSNKKNIDSTGASEKSVKQPDFQVIRSVSKGSDPARNDLRTVMKKRWVRIAGIAVAVFLLILIALPFLINVNSFRPKIESEASSALGRQVTLGNLSLSILSGGVRIDDIVVADDPAFSKSPFLTAQSLKVGVELIPLIFSQKIKVTHLTLEKPQISLRKTAGGKWNFSNIGGASGEKTSESSKSGESTPDFSVGELNVNQGTLSVGNANSSAKPVIYDNVNISIEDLSLTSQFSYKLTAQLPGSGDVKISGKGGPINADDAAKTPLSMTVKVNNLSVGALGLIDPRTGIAGLVSFDGTLSSDGSQAKAVGLMTGKQLKLSPKGTPAPKTITVRHTVNFDVGKQSGSIAQGDISIGSAQAHLTGTFNGRGETLVVNLKLDGPNMPVDELQPMLPSVGVVLPSGSQLKGGTLSADLAITGPLDRAVITGPIRLTNTQLANFNLGSQLGALSAFAGKAASNPDTSIQNASLVARVAPEGMKADDINLDAPAIGVITGAGTVSPAGDLAFKMLANLKGGAVGGMSKVVGAASGQGGIPFAISGTTSDPKFVPDVGGAVTGLATGQIANVAKGQVPGTKGLTKGLDGILGNKKQ